MEPAQGLPGWLTEKIDEWSYLFQSRYGFRCPALEIMDAASVRRLLLSEILRCGSGKHEQTSTIQMKVDTHTSPAPTIVIENGLVPEAFRLQDDCAAALVREQWRFHKEFAAMHGAR